MMPDEDYPHPLGLHVSENKKRQERGVRRIVLSRQKGWRLPPNTVVVSRPSKWGNPFKVGKELNVWDVVDKYRQWLLNTNEGLEIYSRAKLELRGKNLACWCKSSPCHADVLLEIANPPNDSKLRHGG